MTFSRTHVVWNVMLSHQEIIGANWAAGEIALGWRNVASITIVRLTGLLKRHLSCAHAFVLMLLGLACAHPSAIHAQAPRPCPAPPISMLPTAADPATARKPVAGDYFLVNYDAASRLTSWSDYHHWYDPGARDENVHQILRNASFLPVVYTREKIAVHVCNLHFTDQLTVTISPLVVTEGGADIRGFTSTAPLTALTSTLDTIQMGTATGVVAPESGLGFGPPPATGATVVSGVVTGSLQSPGPTYTYGAVTASGEQLALMMFAWRKNADALADSVAAMQADKGPGGIVSINAQLASVTAKVNSDSGGQNAAADAAGFDEDITTVQSLSGQLTTLAGALSAQAFGSRAITLNNNYATLRGILDLVEQGFLQHNCQPQLPPGVPPPPIAAMTPAQIGALTAPQVAAMNPAQLAALTASQVAALTTAQLTGLTPPQIAALQGLHAQVPEPGIDQPPCSVFEKEKFHEFTQAYESTLIQLGEPNVAAFKNDSRDSRRKMFDTLDDLKQDLQSIDTDTGNIFTAMNNWYQHSAVEQTDLVAPANNNTVERISIIIQRGYTPFTLANNPTASTAAATVVPAAAAATTSTPAHSAKTILVEVHRLANFNLAGGVMVIHVPTQNYTVVSSPTPSIPVQVSPPTNPVTYTGTYTGICNGQPIPVPPVTGSTPSSSTNPPAYACVVSTQKTTLQVAAMVGIVWYPWGRDYFPRQSGLTNPKRNFLPSLLIASSVTSLGSAVGAINFEPISGIDLFAGVGSANKTVLPTNLANNPALPTGYSLQTATQLHYGFTTGIAFDFGLFSQLFSKPAGPVLP